MAFVMGNQQHSIAIHRNPSHPHTIEDVLFFIGWSRCSSLRLDLIESGMTSPPPLSPIVSVPALVPEHSLTKPIAPLSLAPDKVPAWFIVDVGGVDVDCARHASDLHVARLYSYALLLKYRPVFDSTNLPHLGDCRCWQTYRLPHVWPRKACLICRAV
jgi:hypothetical protein